MQFISIFPHSYSGYTPRVKYTYGETFGNTTGRWFQDYRAATLNTSKGRMGRGGDKFLPFPTYYTNNPDHVLGARTSSRDRWLAAPKYKLLNLDDRDGAIKTYDKVCFLSPEAFLSQRNTLSSCKAFGNVNPRIKCCINRIASEISFSCDCCAI